MKTDAQRRAQVAAWRRDGLRIVFTNGVFDVLHIGHATYLSAAKALGDKLVVGINSDSSVRRLGKGPERPIHMDTDRAALLSHLSAVDMTWIFEEDTPMQLIEMVKPDILVKGGDYDPAEENPAHKEYIVGREAVLQWGGEVKAIPLVPGHSTTAILSKTRPAQD